ncbi:MAG TPA: hypothetical protein VMS11_12475 [Solirubrobacterales bacterium]|nr:hypothetical protein [Solirubrobacterales bacterium]
MEKKDTAATTAGMKPAGYYDAHSEYQRRVLEAGEAAIEGMVGEVPAEGIDGALAIARRRSGSGSRRVLR